MRRQIVKGPKEILQKKRKKTAGFLWRVHYNFSEMKQTSDTYVLAAFTGDYLIPERNSCASLQEDALKEAPKKVKGDF